MRKHCRLRRNRLLGNHREIIEEIVSMIRHTLGRPNIEDSQSELLGAIVDIANRGLVAVDNRRCTDTIQSCLTLDSLKEQLDIKGYRLSRTAMYYRLLSKNSRTIDGQQHVHTIPVRIRRPKNTLHKYHDDIKFAQSIIRNLKQLACTSGNKVVFYLSQDERCRISMEIPAVQTNSFINEHENTNQTS